MLLPSCADADAGGRPAAGIGCVDPAPCVYVSPDPAKVSRPGTIYVYRGSGWRPNRAVQAEYGSYCPPRASACAGVGLATRFKADRRGRFTFRLRHGNLLPRGVPRPAGAGGEADTIEFVQWSGREYRSRRIERDAIPKPPPSTPAQRREARAIATVMARAGRALDEAERAVQRSSDAYTRQLRLCRDHLRRFDEGSPQGRVVSSLIGLAFEGSLLIPVRPQLDALASDLELIDAQDPVLRAGRDAWIAALRRPRAWPQPDLCTVVEQWSRTGFDLAAAPVSPDADYSLELMHELRSTPAVAEGRHGYGRSAPAARPRRRSRAACSTSPI